MPARITLTVASGPLEGKQFVFEERTTVLLGKQSDCHIRFPKEYGTVSRHHCLIDLNPPDARIRDLGSRNGTHVNDRLIGKRSVEQSLEEARRLSFAEVDLSDGDIIKIGKARLRVAIHAPCVCCACSKEIPPEQQEQAREASGQYRCVLCQATVPPQFSPGQPTKSTRACVRCGRDVSQEAGRSAGDYVCVSCRSAPDSVIGKLLDDANRGANELQAIRDHHIVKELGRGGMGAVYLARHGLTGRHVALKVMLPSVAANARAQEMFLREVANTCALDHPNVVRLFEAGCFRGTFFFTLEYCEAGSLFDQLKKRGKPMSVDSAVKLTLHALTGLDYAHQVALANVKLADGDPSKGRGLVHRDIKPHNLFPARTGEKYAAKIGDYGLAKAFDLAGLSGLTATGAAAGTPTFMPRQQLLEYKYAKPDVDVWAMAASLYYMLTLQPPRDFGKGRDPWQVVLQTKAVPIRQRAPEVPTRLATVIDEALIDDPEIRFKTAAEFRRRPGSRCKQRRSPTPAPAAGMAKGRRAITGTCSLHERGGRSDEGQRNPTATHCAQRLPHVEQEAHARDRLAPQADADPDRRAAALVRRPARLRLGQLACLLRGRQPAAARFARCLRRCGVEGHDRPNYLVWQEGRPPQIAIELTSSTTHRTDTGSKMTLYREGHAGSASEYFLSDPDGDDSRPALTGVSDPGARAGTASRMDATGSCGDTDPRVVARHRRNGCTRPGLAPAAG